MSFRISYLLTLLCPVLILQASEQKSLVQTILTDKDTYWHDLHLLPKQLIGSLLLYNHPIVSFILGRMNGNHWTSRERYALTINPSSYNTASDNVVTASTDTAKIWDTETGQCIVMLEGHSEGINSSAFNSAGDKVVTASTDTTAKIWDTATGRCIVTLEGHDAGVNSAVFNGEGDKVVTASDDKTAKIWYTDTGKCITTLIGHAGRIYSATFNKVGDKVVTVSEDETAKLWDISILQMLYDHLLREDTVTLNQAVILDGIYEILICRRVVQLRETQKSFDFAQLRKLLKSVVGKKKTQSRESQDTVMCFQDMYFDFNRCEHLQKDYEKLPQEIQNILDPYVKKVETRQDSTSSTNSTTSERTLKGQL